MKVLFWLCAVVALTGPLQAQQPATAHPWRYTLLEGSTIIDDCPICGRPTIFYPLRGTFELLLDNIGPLFTTYRITNVQFYAGSKTSPLYTVTGGGTYRLGGQLAVQQQMSLQTKACDPGPACRDVTFTNNNIAGVAFPLIQISVTETQASLLSVYTMQLVAAPVREFWFVVTNAFTSTNAATMVRAGDVLSHGGRIVRTNARLLETIGITNPLASVRVDAFDAAPGGEIVFSLSQDAVSPTLGTLHEGDLLSSRGHVAKTSQQLTAAFGIQPVVPDVGLDAVHVMASGEILFSIRTNIFAEAKGVMLHHGDVLSNSGQIVKSNQQLLVRFHPTNKDTDYGLDALYVWLNGEMWFSTETGFQDQQLGAISDGDLLSTEGIIVFKNAELVAEFGAPTGSNFGLGDIFVVSDAAAAAPPRLLTPRMVGNDIWLQWAGTNRVFQVQRATTVTGPWEAGGQIDPAPFLRDANALSFQQTFYQLQAW